jgi:hypothetical protein
MKLSDNPIFITRKRLVHRNGVLAAALIAVLIGFCLLLGLMESLRELGEPGFHNFKTPQAAGKAFYGWIVGLEILVIVIGGFTAVSRALTEDRKAGLWDSNRLTPLKPKEILLGYWFGPALREFYMALALAGFGLLIVLIARLPLTLWLGTQTLVASTALFFGLLGLLCGMAFQRSPGLLIFLGLFFVWPMAFMAPGRMLINFLLPIYGIGNLFSEHPPGKHDYGSDWNSPPEIFGVPFPAVLLSLILQIVIGLFVWRALVRKTANPFQPLLLRWEAFALFGVLVGSQHALLWDLWSGGFPNHGVSRRGDFDHETLLHLTHGGTLALGALLIFLASPPPENVRVQSLRLGFKNLGAVFSRSAVSLALALAGVAGLALLTQFVFGLKNSWPTFVVAAVNLAEIFLVFALLLEFCRLRHRRRALGFVALWLFVLCIIPFILAGVFANEAFARISLLAPGFTALAGDHEYGSLRYCTLLAHAGVVLLLFIGWRRQWKRLLENAA